MEKEEKFYIDAAVEVLKRRFGIKNPTGKHIKEMTALLFHSWLKRSVRLTDYLTSSEKLCLFWSSQGKTYLEIAEILGISPKTVRSYESKILKKLNCKNMKQAIVIGIRYGDIAIIE